MASGFVSSVYHRLFRSKGKDRSPKTARPKPHPHHHLSSSSSSSPSPSPSTPSSSVGQKPDRVGSSDQEDRPLPEAKAKKREQPKTKTPLLSSLRKKTRPLSCIAARPDSPTGIEADTPPGRQTPPADRSRADKSRTQQQQQGQKKPRRPLSCIVQPPSPQLLPSADSHPELLPRRADRETGPGGATDVTKTKTQQPVARDVQRTQTRPRPVSCFVEPPPDRSPPPYSRRTQAAPLYVPVPVPGDQYVPFQVGSPLRCPPCYLEASRRSPNLSSLLQPRLDDRHPGAPLPRYTDSSPQPEVRYTDSAYMSCYPGELQKPSCSEERQQPRSYSSDDRQRPRSYPADDRQQPGPYPADDRQQPGPYPADDRQQPGPYPADDRQQPGPYLADDRQQPGPYPADDRQQPGPYPAQSPRQLPPITVSSPSLAARGGRCGDVNCFLDPCPYRLPPSSQSPAYGGYSYDLKTYFPAASSPARRYARPQSACFLCEPRPCCVETGCRPRSQCYFPDRNLPWIGTDVLAGHQLPQPAPEEASEGDRVLQTDWSVPWSQPPPSASVDADASSFQPVPPGQDSARLPPRPARRTLAPRPKSTCFLSTESDASPMSSPAPSPRPRRFPMKKYRSADCLDRVDELENLNVSPPPAKPLSYFTDPASQQRTTAGSSDKKPEEIFTSAEMLEKVGQPRPREQHKKTRPVSCFAAGCSSADESGYLSNATLAGSGWLGGLSASTGDILELLDADEPSVADDELSLERASSVRKAWSVCSLLRQDSLQDRSFTVMRRRRQKMKDRRHTTNQRSSSTETDDGVEVKGGEVTASTSTPSLPDKDGGGESATVAGIPLDGKQHVPGSCGVVVRLHSTHMKAWQIRLRRKQMMKKRRSADRTGSRVETLV